MSGPIYRLEIGPSHKHGIVYCDHDDESHEVDRVTADSRDALIREATTVARLHRDGEPQTVLLDLDAEDPATRVTVNLDGRCIAEEVVRHGLKAARRAA